MTAIEWTDATWNPVTGCTRVSPGCANCYIERTPPFRTAGRVFARVGNEETTGVRLHPDRLEKPLRWRKPRRVFVCSLADLFHEEVPDSYIGQVCSVMRRASQHTFQVLTKRPERARELLSRWWSSDSAEWSDYGHDAPPSNVWLGTSIENARYTWRADVLREIPAAVRFISAEPLLGSLFPAVSDDEKLRAQDAWAELGNEPARERLADSKRTPLNLEGIDWVIAGGESGPGARPMHPDWARELRDACIDQRGYAVAVGNGPRPPYPGETAFFFKQWGEWAPGEGDSSGSSLTGDRRITRRAMYVDHGGRERDTNELSSFRIPEDWAQVARFGKKAAGRLLDGREWNEYPEAAS